MVPNTKQSTGPSAIVLDPFIVFNWLHRAAGENCKKDVNQVAWKGYIEGLIARLESPYQLRHVLVPPSSIILIFQIYLLSYQEQQKLYKSTSNQINMSHFVSHAHCWEDPNSSHIQYSEHLKLSSSWFRIRIILKDWDPTRRGRRWVLRPRPGPGWLHVKSLLLLLFLVQQGQAERLERVSFKVFSAEGNFV